LARTGESQATNAQSTYLNNANQSFDRGQQDISQFGINIATLAEGKDVGANPYQAPAYLANEAQLQSSALNGENAAADTQLRQENRRSGGLNTGSTQGEISGLALRKMRIANQLTAGRSAQDYEKNIAFQKYLASAPLSAASAEERAYGTSTSGQSSALGDLTQFGLASFGPYMQRMQMIPGALAGAGQGVGAALAGRGK
jgi:hypothetical protein